jgi:hypothetical protein
MKKAILLILFWCISIFSVISQMSDKFIYWLSPNSVSLLDERMTYTFVPILINFFVLFLLWKIRIQKSFFRIFLLLNAVFFLYFIYYQFGDMGLGKLG